MSATPSGSVSIDPAELLHLLGPHPDDADGIMVAAGLDIEQVIAADGHRRQPLRGFEDIYADFVHYILRCTYRIWEENNGAGTDLLYTHYAEDIPVHTSEGTIVGRDAVIEFTDAAKRSFPGIVLHGEDVIWAGNEDDGFHSSHRLTHIGTNLGPTVYGPPTGRPMRKTAVAHCFARENVISEEWVTRDELALVRALGFDEVALASRLGTEEAAARGGLLAEVLEVPAPDAPVEALTEAEDHVLAMFAELWGNRRLGRSATFYADRARIETATARTLAGPAGMRRFVQEWLETFSDVQVVPEHIMSNRRRGGQVVATRWRLTGTHDGHGRYGPATRRRVHLIGFSHHLVHEDRIVGEWTVFDEFSLLKQIYAQPPSIDTETST